MQSFHSIVEMIDTHRLMYGEAGETIAHDIIACASLFTERLDPLHIRAILAPIEIAPYCQHSGYSVLPSNGHAEEHFSFILANRSYCGIAPDGSIVFTTSATAIRDFVMHELTHLRQAYLLRERGYKQAKGRGSHRDKAWYAAIAEAAPRYLAVHFPEAAWPVGQRVYQHRLDEVTATHWPSAFRPLVAANDQRLPKVAV
jgi:hypothetical protein